jgi:hypothetical protein
VAPRHSIFCGVLPTSIDTGSTAFLPDFIFTTSTPLKKFVASRANLVSHREHMHAAVDSLLFTPKALRHLAAQVGSSQIVMERLSIPLEETAADHILDTSGYS